MGERVALRCLAGGGAEPQGQEKPGKPLPPDTRRAQAEQAKPRLQAKAEQAAGPEAQVR